MAFTACNNEGKPKDGENKGKITVVKEENNSEDEGGASIKRIGDTGEPVYSEESSESNMEGSEGGDYKPFDEGESITASSETYTPFGGKGSAKTSKGSNTNYNQRSTSSTRKASGPSYGISETYTKPSTYNPSRYTTTTTSRPYTPPPPVITKPVKEDWTAISRDLDKLINNASSYDVSGFSGSGMKDAFNKQQKDAQNIFSEAKDYLDKAEAMNHTDMTALKKQVNNIKDLTTSLSKPSKGASDSEIKMLNNKISELRGLSSKMSSAGSKSQAESILSQAQKITKDISKSYKNISTANETRVKTIDKNTSIVQKAAGALNRLKEAIDLFDPPKPVLSGGRPANADVLVKDALSYMMKISPDNRDRTMSGNLENLFSSTGEIITQDNKRYSVSTYINKLKRSGPYDVKLSGDASFDSNGKIAILKIVETKMKK